MWSNVEISGHSCEVFEPNQPALHSGVVIYLHGVRLGRLQDKPVLAHRELK